VGDESGIVTHLTFIVLNYKSHDSINIHLKNYFISHQFSIIKHFSNIRHNVLVLTFCLGLFVIFLDAIGGLVYQFKGVT
jgi:hypothetical protein